MSAINQVLAAYGAAAATDPNYSSVVLLLHMDGTNGSTTITDNAPTPNTCTAQGSSVLTTSIVKFGSAAFSCSNGRVTVPDATQLNLTTGDWTIEFWFYLQATGTQARLIDKETTNGLYPFAINCGQVTAGKMDFRSFNTGGTLLTDMVGTTTIAATTWYHVAVCRSGNTYYLFLDGTQEATKTQTDALRVAADPINIGNNGSGTGYGGAIIDDVRITKGVARYTSNFTRPTAAFPNS